MKTDEEVFREAEGLIERLSVIDTECRALEVAKDERIKAVVAEFAPQIDPLTQERDGLVERLGDLWVEYEPLMRRADSKTTVFRSGTMSAKESPGSLEIDDEKKAIAGLKRLRKYRAFTRVKVEIDKAKLKKVPEVFTKLPGVRLVKKEFLYIKLARTKIELKEDLHPHRQRIN